MRNLLSVLALTLATGAMARPALRLDPASLARQKAMQPQRMAQAQSQLRAQRASLGLGERETLVAKNAFTNLQGQAIVRLEHTFDGFRVWGSQAVAQVLPDGGLRTQTKSLRAGVSVGGEPRLAPAEALRIALKHQGAAEPHAQAPQVERVVFPAEFLGGLASRIDPSTGRTVLDREKVVHAHLSDPFVWAYEVRTGRRDGPNGPEELSTLVDARTGAVLRITNGMEAQSAPTPAIGSGTGLYRGAVALNTSQMADGSFDLYDTTRGLLPNPGLSYYTPDGSGWSPTGLQVWYDQHDASGATTYMSFLFQSNPVNSWGDGLPFTQWGDENAVNGQTAGVDAMSAMTTTWDMYKQVFGREGLDGNGTTAMAYVLETNPYFLDNAWWSIGEHGAYLGAGSSPVNPKGFQSMTDLDVVAHEMTHGLTSPNWDHYWFNGAGLEEAGLNEATSDFFAQMVKAWSTRGAGAPSDAIPATGADWQIGAGVNHGAPLRRMDLPSADLRSRDGWHDGIQYMDGHYSSGPLNRALFFLSQGASAGAGAAHSDFLPGGMAGIGNDATARIWLKAVTEGLIGDGTGGLTYADARAAALAASDDLFGAGSTESIAVENAFAAVNVGDAHGQAPRTLVRFAPWRNGDYIETSHPYSPYANRQVFPKGETVVPRITVDHASNTAVTWSLGGPSMFNGAEYSVSEGGVLNADGSWTTPNVMSWHAITATSQADPHQLAEGRVFLINMDTDQDLEQDAMDMGDIAFSWYLSNGLNPAHSVFQAPWVDDDDVSFFVDAFKAAWPAQ